VRSTQYLNNSFIETFDEQAIRAGENDASFAKIKSIYERTIDYIRLLKSDILAPALCIRSEIIGSTLPTNMPISVIDFNGPADGSSYAQCIEFIRGVCKIGINNKFANSIYADLRSLSIGHLLTLIDIAGVDSPAVNNVVIMMKDRAEYSRFITEVTNKMIAAKKSIMMWMRVIADKLDAATNKRIEKELRENPHRSIKAILASLQTRARDIVELEYNKRETTWMLM
jgi:hypothetical protein